MIRANRLRATLMAATLIAAPSAWAADSASQAFLTNAIQGNLAEISVGQLAQEKGTTDAVKSYGKTLVDDHTKANDDAMSVAKGMGMTPPMAPNAEQKSMYDKLASETGATFDHDFITGMVDDHKKDVAEYQKAATMQDAAGQYAGKTLPTLQGHLSTAEKLAGDMGNITNNSASMMNGTMALVSGANSFTENEAKARIERAGFSNVSGLKKDDNGIWRGTASMNGKTTPIGLDYKGNVGK